MSKFQMLFKSAGRKILRLLGWVTIRERKKEFILNNINHDTKKTILDIGCWGSLLPEELSKKGHKVFGIDAQEYGKAKRFTFIKADILTSKLPFESFFFDYIVCLSTIEHIGLGFYGDKKDKYGGDRKALERMSRLLKNQGRLLITIPFGGKYKENDYQRIHTKESFQSLIQGLFEIEKEQYWIPLKKKRWISASENEAMRVYHAYPESNNACFVLRKV